MTMSPQRTIPYLPAVRGTPATVRGAPASVRGTPAAAIEVDGSWDRPDWQRMWNRTQSQEWSTLALVAADDQTSTFDVANLIAKLARDHGENVRVADLRALRPKHVEAFLEGTRWETDQGGRVVFATRSVGSNLATVPIARAADCAILCVSLGTTSIASIKETIEQIGRKHFLGSLLVRGGAQARPKQARPASKETGAKAQP